MYFKKEFTTCYNVWLPSWWYLQHTQSILYWLVLLTRSSCHITHSLTKITKYLQRLDMSLEFFPFIVTFRVKKRTWKAHKMPAGMQSINKCPEACCQLDTFRWSWHTALPQSIQQNTQEQIQWSEWLNEELVRLIYKVTYGWVGTPDPRPFAQTASNIKCLLRSTTCENCIKAGAVLKLRSGCQRYLTSEFSLSGQLSVPADHLHALCRRRTEEEVVQLITCRAQL